MAQATQQQTPQTDSNNIDPDEIARFSAIADEWWDPTGKFAPLHKINPVRLQFIREQIARHFDLDERDAAMLKGISIVDIGCGGGLLCEPLTNMGASVTGVEPAEKSVKAAMAHADKMGLEIDYRNTQAETLVEAGEQFDVVLNMEVIEHVPDMAAFIETSQQLLKPGGLMLLSTLNRTVKSFAMAIVGAEYVLRWLPRGTHQWNKFVKPAELKSALRKTGLDPVAAQGMVFNPLSDKWSLSDKDLDVNYLVAARNLKK